MRIKMIALWFMFVIISLLTLWLFYKVIDQAVTIAHYGQEIKLISDQRNILIHVINSTNIAESENQLRKYLREYDDHSFEKEDGEVVANQVRFLFKNEHLDKVSVEKN
jgi:hypothetical protein